MRVINFSFHTLVCSLVAALLYQAAPAMAQKACTTNPERLAEGAVQLQVTDNISLAFHPDTLLQQSEAQDIDKNETPDLAQNARAQLRVANRWFAQIFEISSPLDSIRYKHVSGLQLCIEPLSVKANGFAPSQPLCRPSNSSPAYCVLRMYVAARVKPHNQSPLHELFHLYQYTFNRFSQPWLTEGTAVWAEGAFSQMAPRQSLLPENEAALGKMLAGGYAAGTIWNRLTFLLDPDGSSNSDPNLSEERYVSGQSVWPGRKVYGASFIRDVFLELSKASAPLHTGGDVNNYIAWKAVRKVARDHASRITPTAELVNFLSLEGNGAHFTPSHLKP